MRISSWNLRDGLSDEARADDIAIGIESMGSDIVFIPEAYDTEVGVNSDLLDELGYDVQLYAYNDMHPEHRGKPGEMPSHGFAVLSRLAVESRVFYTGNNRNSVMMELGDAGLRVAGVHFDDRDEDTRLTEAEDVLSIGVAPDLVIGDFNALDKNDWKSNILRSPAVGAIAQNLPTMRLRSLATRLSGMAEGELTNFFLRNGYRDADSSSTPTMLLPGIDNPNMAIFNLDRAFYLPDSLSIVSHTVHRVRGSDHLPISVDIEIS